MVASRPTIRPTVAIALVIAVLVVLVAYELGVAGGVRPRVVAPSHPGAPVTTTGPEDAGPGVVNQSSSSTQSTQSTSCGPQPCKPEATSPTKINSGGPEDAGPGVTYQQSGGYSSGACGPRPCKP